MCRLFGFRSAVPSRVDRWLVDAPRSLSFLSQEHRHGWGIASYAAAGDPSLARGVEPAHADPAFHQAARAAFGDCVLGHIRRRSVGSFGLENTHPFRHGRLVFAHNGTIERFDENRPDVEAHILPGLRGELRGSTDSERAFLVAVSRLAARGALERPTAEDLAESLAFATGLLARLPCAESHKLTFLLTDGVHLVGSRSGEKELWLTSSAGPGPSYVAVASEPLTDDEPWTALPDRQVFAVGPSLQPRSWSLDGFGVRIAA